MIEESSDDEDFVIKLNDKTYESNEEDEEEDLEDMEILTENEEE